MRLARRLTAGAMALAIIAGVTGCGASEDKISSPTSEPVTETTSEETTAETIRSESEELTVTSSEETTEAKETTTSSKTEEVPEEVSPYFTKTELEIKEAVNNALKAFQTADVNGVFDYTDMEIFYYMAYEKVPSKEEINDAFLENGTLIAPLDNESITWEILNIAPVNESTYVDMNAFLNSGFSELVEKVNNSDEYNLIDNFGSISDFESIKKTFGITDVYAVQINAEYPEGENSSPALSPAIESSTCFYVFKMNGNWKLDIPYSTYFMVDKMIKEYENR